MESPYKIRAWDKQNNHYWHFNFMVSQWESEPVIGEIYITTKPKSYWLFELCSGYKDEFGNWIYQNDKVSAEWGLDFVEGVVRMVEGSWIIDDGSANFIMLVGEETSGIKIIGNINYEDL